MFLLSKFRVFIHVYGDCIVIVTYIIFDTCFVVSILFVIWSHRGFMLLFSSCKRFHSRVTCYMMIIKFTLGGFTLGVIIVRWASLLYVFFIRLVTFGKYFKLVSFFRRIYYFRFARVKSVSRILGTTCFCSSRYVELRILFLSRIAQ